MDDPQGPKKPTDRDRRDSGDDMIVFSEQWQRQQQRWFQQQQQRRQQGSAWQKQAGSRREQMERLRRERMEQLRRDQRELAGNVPSPLAKRMAQGIFGFFRKAVNAVRGIFGK